MTTPQSASYEADLLERLKDKKYALEYLRAVVEEEQDELSEQVFLQCIRDIAKAHGIIPMTTPRALAELV